MLDFASINEHIGRQVRLRRQALGLSVSELAEASNMFTVSQLERYESGSHHVPATVLWVLTRYLDCSCSYFFEGLMPATPST
ncbi:helix-turn-helix domain-containing protein [Brevundimonas sp.]|jgi:transcriptional regulator with XRE-family HTH domain|uniref:helix-turn-helix domain-containing protein n=1 Tax=Brevundimonas sp. TaxID=1871086 RepID=UPI00345AFE37